MRPTWTLDIPCWTLDIPVVCVRIAEPCLQDGVFSGSELRRMYMMNLTVYLAGEIHTDWRARITEGIREFGLPVTAL